MIKSWATIEWYLSPAANDLPVFMHAGTQVRDDGQTTGTRRGDTIWILKDSPVPVGLAWEWVEVRPGLLMLADPNAMITNLKLVDEHQQTLGTMDHIRVCNRLVHALPWQINARAKLVEHDYPQPEQLPLMLPAAEPLSNIKHPTHAAATRNPNDLRISGIGNRKADRANTGINSERPPSMFTRASDRDSQHFLRPLRRAA